MIPLKVMMGGSLVEVVGAASFSSARGDGTALNTCPPCTHHTVPPPNRCVRVTIAGRELREFRFDMKVSGCNFLPLNCDLLIFFPPAVNLRQDN